MDAMQKLFSKKGGDTNGVSSWKKEVVQGTEFTVPSSYTLVKKLGSGAYGTVAAFEDKAASPPRTVAVKLVKSAFNDLIDAKRIVREVKLLRHFEHDNVVSILDIFPPDSPDFEDIYIIMDLMDTDLHRVIYSNQSLTNEHIQYFLYQLLRGLKYVHSANVVHRDLKPSNILVNRDCELKICDFGLSRGFEEGQEDSDFTHYVVTRWYRAPEVILTAKKNTRGR
jgi:mitogen-activated protein kinase 1/3